MRYTGHYSPVDCDYDVDHEITKNIKKLIDLIKSIDYDGKAKNRKAVLKAMANEIIEKI